MFESLLSHLWTTPCDFYTTTGTFINNKEKYNLAISLRCVLLFHPKRHAEKHVKIVVWSDSSQFTSKHHESLLKKLGKHVQDYTPF